MSVRRSTLVMFVVALLCGLAYGVGWADQHGALPWAPRADAAEVSTGSTAKDDPSTSSARDDSTRHDRPGTVQSDKPVAPPQKAAPPALLLQPGPDPVGSGRLRPEGARPAGPAQADRLVLRDVTDYYGSSTTTAVKGFQAKRHIPVTGEVDQRTLDRLHGMTRQPTQAELTNQPPPSSGGNAPGALDPRCLTGRALCVDKSSRTLRWVVDGQVLKTVDVRFGSDELPTREGAFSVSRKSRDHVSSLYHTSMPFAMFFSGGQAVHYSPDFAATGYNGASHGCVNVRDYAAISWLYDQVAVGDKVIVYWS